MTTTSPLIYVGNRVYIDPAAPLQGVARFAGITFTVESMPTRSNAVNAVIRPVDGGRGVRIKPRHLRLGNAPDVTAPAVTRGELIPLSTIFKIGTLVRYRGELCVVTGYPRSPRTGHRLSPLGGSNMYWRAAAAADCEVIPLDRVIVAEP